MEFPDQDDSWSRMCYTGSNLGACDWLFHISWRFQEKDQIPKTKNLLDCWCFRVEISIPWSFEILTQGLKAVGETQHANHPFRRLPTFLSFHQEYPSSNQTRKLGRCPFVDDAHWFGYWTYHPYLHNDYTYIYFIWKYLSIYT